MERNHSHRKQEAARPANVGVRLSGRALTWIKTASGRALRRSKKILGWGFSSVNRTTATATVVIAVATIVYTVFSFQQWHSMSQQLSETRREFDESQRPWIAITGIQVNGPITFEKDGARLKLRFALQNVGHSPAAHVFLAMEPVVAKNGDYLADLTAERESFCDKMLVASKTLGSTMFQGQPAQIQDAETVIPNKDILAARQNLGKPLLPLNAIACVAYRSTQSGVGYFTGDTYDIGYFDLSDGAPSIPAEKIQPHLSIYGTLTGIRP